VNMTSYYDAANRVYPVTMAAIRHYAQYKNLVGGHKIKQTPRASPDLYTPLISRQGCQICNLPKCQI